MDAKPPKWRPESDDAATFARGIFAGEIDRTKKTFDTFLQNNRSLAQTYHYDDSEKGARNLRNNYLNLYDKIQKWKKGDKGKKLLIQFLAVVIIMISCSNMFYRHSFFCCFQT